MKRAHGLRWVTVGRDWLCAEKKPRRSGAEADSSSMGPNPIPVMRIVAQQPKSRLNCPAQARLSFSINRYASLDFLELARRVL